MGLKWIDFTEKLKLKTHPSLLSDLYPHKIKTTPLITNSPHFVITQTHILPLNHTQNPKYQKLIVQFLLSLK